jgi:hypothetical protein
VSWRQRADRIEVFAKCQLLALEGRRLRPPARPVILFVAPRKDESVASWDGAGREREFGRIARRVPLKEFPSEALGQLATLFDGATAASFGVEGPLVLALIVEDKSSRSAPSPRVALTPVSPPLARLRDFTATPEEKGVRLAWTTGDDPRVRFVRVYRWKSGGTAPWVAWRVVASGSHGVVDDSASYGEDLVYEATAAAEGQGPPVESAPLGAPTVAFRDTFPPAPPQDLDAAPETGRIRVFWRPGGSSDEALVRVERQKEGEADFRQVGVVEMPDSYFVDEQVETDARYRYRVTAVDKLGNAAASVGPSDWVSPRPRRSE